jgi:hypothetical protein
MFFRSKNKPSADDVKFQFKCDHGLIGDMYYLTNGFIISIGEAPGGNKTKILLFDPVEKKCIAEKILDSLQPTIILLNQDSFLVKFSDKKSCVLSSVSLDILEENRSAHSYYTECALGNGRYAHVVDDDPNVRGPEGKKIIKTNSFQSLLSIKASLPIVLEDDRPTTTSYASNLTLLANGKYVFKVLGHNSSYFKLFLLERDMQATEIEFKQLGIIAPRRARSSDSTASGSFVPLPDGRLLTYHLTGNHFQVWEGTTCVDRWNWDDVEIKCDDKSHKEGFLTRDVLSMPDGEHLLIRSDKRIFLFNMKTRNMRAVDIGELTPWCTPLVNLNGEVVIRGQAKNKEVMLLSIDLQEMKAYREQVTECLDKTANLYEVMNKMVTDYLAPNLLWAHPKAKNSAKGETENKKESRCSIM